jgi:hypothetical protein
MSSNARRSDRGLATADGRAARVHVRQSYSRLTDQPDTPHQAAGFLLPAWMLLLLGLVVGLGMLALFEPQFFVGW